MPLFISYPPPCLKRSSLNARISCLQSAFQRRRKQPAAGPALFVATPHDPESATWTNERPTPPELRRLVAYARSSAALLSQQIAGLSDDARWHSLFRTPLGAYDFLILLRTEALPHPHRTLFPTAEALGVDHRVRLPAQRLWSSAGASLSVR